MNNAPRKPIFDKTDDRSVCADLINQPHDDYPRRVNSTLLCLTELEKKLEWTNLIDAKTVLDIHKQLFPDENFWGKWRDVRVSVWGFIPCAPMLIPHLMDTMRPIQFNNRTKKKLVEWYEKFETIHPFQDGNGRVWWIILAAISKKLFNTYAYDKTYLITPQEQAIRKLFNDERK